MTGPIYDRLSELLELVHSDGVGALSAGSAQWLGFKATLPAGNGRGANGNNVRSSLQTLGVIDSAGLTPLGSTVRAFHGPTAQESIKRTIGRHILLEKGGWAFCHALEVAGGQGREEIWDFYQAQYQPDSPEHLMNVGDFNKFLTWLGVSDGTYTLDVARFESFIGVGIDELRGIGNLAPEIKLCLLALLTLDRTVPHSGREIQAAAEAIGGTRPNVHKMQAYAKKLEDLGLIDYSHANAPIGAPAGTATDPLNRGRRGQWRVRPGGLVDQLTADFLNLYLPAASDPDLARIVRTSFAQLRLEIEDLDETIAAKALEWFAAKVCWRLGLRAIEVRSLKVIGGIEVDVIADRSQPAFQRYLVQCKRQESKLGPPVIAKEIGTAAVEKIENIIFVSTGGYTPSARAFRRQVIRETGKNILMLDDRDVATICADESRLYRIVARENAFCRAVRTGDDGFWLPLQIQWVLPSLIAANGLTIGDTEDAWQAFRGAETNVAPSLKKAFVDYFVHHFTDLEAGTPVQLELPF